MPQIKSAKKRLKQNEVAEKRNSAYKSRMRSSRRSFNEALEAGDADKIKEAYAAYCSSLDKAVKKNIIKRNTATRSKRRAAEKMRSVESAA
ncbi:30S ribosomal protein S20 [Kiritimatiellaeota bacterium B1221]|nr:30S ribosomal protein S20 [Kiritimatiellaeota bacterium B1221]